MLEDIFSGILRAILYIFFHLFIEVICFYTGEIVFFVVSLGNKKPRWDYYSNEKPQKFVIFTEFSVWVGILFWGAVIVLIANFLM